jgi:hypothetical protein
VVVAQLSRSSCRILALCLRHPHRIDIALEIVSSIWKCLPQEADVLVCCRSFLQWRASIRR